MDSKIKVKIICPIHGIFEQRPNDHLSGYGCKYCANNIKYTNNIFIEKANVKHNNFYDYSLVEYKNNKIKVKIVCPIHGVFEQRPNDHLNGRGCPMCKNVQKHTNIKFIEKVNKIHNNFYDYSLVEYINNRYKIKIICPIHGIFIQKPLLHLNGCGCPQCYNPSKGEVKIAQLLKQYNISFIKQKTFENCIYRRKLKFDFYLPEYNYCIEYDGEQHFKANEFFGGEKEFKELQKKDKIKNDYCLNNNIKLIRIKYNENIEDILNKEIKNMN
jgi:hypothetical protein